MVGDILDGTSAAVGDIVDAILNSAILASPGLIWLSDMSRSDIGYYGCVNASTTYRRGCDAYGTHSSDYYYNLDFIFHDTLDEVNLAKGTGTLIAMDFPIFTFGEAIEVANITADSEDVLNATLAKDVSGSVNEDDDTPAYGLFFVCGAIWIYSLWGIISFFVSLVYRLPLVKWLVDEARSELRNLPWLLFQLAYVMAGTYLLEEVVLGVFFSDPLAHIGWLMERGWINGTFLAQDFAVLYLWVWWKAVVPAERARARWDMRMEGVEAVRIVERVVRDRDKNDGSMTAWVLGVFDEADGESKGANTLNCELIVIWIAIQKFANYT